MDITTPSVSQPSSVSSRVDSAVGEARETALSDFNDFLTLLTAQLKHQDPLAPLDSTQFVEQLASFAAVEQQVGSNQKLARLIEQGTSDEISRLSGWIGQTVDAESALFQLGEDAISVDIPVDDAAVTIEAKITNEAGDEIASFPVDGSTEKFEWSGELANQRQAAPGNYGISFSYAYEDQKERLVEAGASGQVVEARVDRDGPILILQSGAVVRPSDVNALRVSTSASNSEAI